MCAVEREFSRSGLQSKAAISNAVETLLAKGTQAIVVVEIFGNGHGAVIATTEGAAMATLKPGETVEYLIEKDRSAAREVPDAGHR